MSRSAVFLLVIGLLQMTADVMRLPPLKASLPRRARRRPQKFFPAFKDWKLSPLGSTSSGRIADAEVHSVRTHARTLFSRPRPL